MASRVELHQFIQSLTSSEKRYIRKYARTHQPKSYLLEIFDAMATFPLQEAQHRLQDRPYASHLHTMRYHLMNMMMKALRDYYSDLSPDLTAENLLMEVEVLIAKDQLKLAEQRLGKAEKICARHGLSLTQKRVLQLRKKIVIAQLGSMGSKKILTQIIEGEQASINHQKAELDIWKCLLQMLQTPASAGDIVEKIPAIDKNMPFRNFLMHAHTCYVGYIFSGNLEKADQSLVDLIAHFEQHPELWQHDPGPLITALNNRIGLLLNRKAYQPIEQLLETIKKLPDRCIHASARQLAEKHLIKTYNLELEMYRDLHQWDRALLAINEIKRFLEQSRCPLPEEYQILFHYQFAYIYFQSKKHHGALAELNQLLFFRKEQPRPDIMAYARLLNLFIHFELKNFQVLRYAVHSYRRYLAKNQIKRPFHSKLLRMFSQLSTLPSGDHMRYLSKFYQKHIKDDQLNMTASELDYLDVKSWLRSKLKQGQNHHQPAPD